MIRSSIHVCAAWLAALPLFVGCSPAGGVAASPASSTDVQFLQSGPGLLEQMRLAPTQTRFSGQRRIWLAQSGQGPQGGFTYDETVHADGQGAFAIEPGQIVAPFVSQAQRELFEILQNAREGFLFRYRDFAVRNVDRLLLSYGVHTSGNVVTVAGRACDEVRFERLRAPRRTYVVAVDQATHLVLRWEERTPAGVPMARMEFTTYDANPDHSAVTMHVDQPSSALDPAIDNRPALGFPLRLPDVVHGYQLDRAERVTGNGRTWARVVYDDGVEPLFYLFSGRAGIHTGTLAPDNDQLAGAATITVYSAGSWTVSQCRHAGAEFLVVGKLDEGRLVETLQSAVE